MFRRTIVYGVFILCLATALFSAEPELLREKDVHTLMQQIFEQHVDKKEITSDILKHSFKIYIDQFDPQRIYLFEDEVKPFTSPTDAQMDAYMAQYKNGNYTAYDKINDTIQNSILRARKWRSEMEKQNTALFKVAKKTRLQNGEELLDPDIKIPFVKTPEEIKARMLRQTEVFIKSEMKHFGEAVVMNRQKQMLDIYEKQMRHFENQYLFQNQNGEPLQAVDQENLFTLHILKALANSLDSHTTFFDASEAYDMRIHLEKELHGIGAVLQQGVEGIAIVQIMADSPVERSGKININDEIIEIDGKSIIGLNFESVMKMIRGDDGTTLSLVVKRKMGKNQPDKLIPVTLQRSPITMSNDRVDSSYETFGDGIIGKLTLHSFYQGDKGLSSEGDLRAAIKKLEKQGKLKGLILDLRENSGGFLTQAVKVAGLFISNGIVVISKYSNGEEQIYRDIDSKEEYKGPLIILTSKATASAAEIVAEALQDYGVALVVGDEQTYGKGTIQSQTVTDNKSTSFFKVTVGKYYTVSGKTPQIKGVKADILVPSQFSREHLGEEYLEYPLSSDTIEPEFNDELADVDPQYKAWFLKFYVPTIQQPTDTWMKMLPVLKKNSEYRIKNSKNYQLFLKGLDGKVDEETADEAENPFSLSSGNLKNFGREDLQMNEAVNITKDMIVLHSLWNSHSVGVETKVLPKAEISKSSSKDEK